VLTDAMAPGGPEAKRVFAAMMEMGKIDIAKIEAARRVRWERRRLGRRPRRSINPLVADHRSRTKS
jgi:hypothetical protein